MQPHPFNDPSAHLGMFEADQAFRASEAARAAFGASADEMARQAELCGVGSAAQREIEYHNNLQGHLWFLEQQRAQAIAAAAAATARQLDATSAATTEEKTDMPPRHVVTDNQTSSRLAKSGASPSVNSTQSTNTPSLPPRMPRTPRNQYRRRRRPRLWTVVTIGVVVALWISGLKDSLPSSDDGAGQSQGGASTAMDVGNLPVVTAPKFCNKEGSLSSIERKTPVILAFENQTRTPIQVFWLDDEGNRVYYQDLPPGERYLQETYVTHAWVFADFDSGKCIRLYQAGRGDARIIVR
jgi:hypothetical protein